MSTRCLMGAVLAALALVASAQDSKGKLDLDD